MDPKDMRSIVIYGDQNFQVLEGLNKLEHWKLHKNEQNGHPYFLEKDEEKIYIHITAENIANTSNVLPQDLKNTPVDLANDALLSLSSDLEKANIEHILDISENEKKSLLNKEEK